jgi:hypothetical protein
MTPRISPVVLAAILAAACGQSPENGVLPRQADATAQVLDPATFVRQTFVHGVPYDQARALGPDASKVLIPLLADPAQEPYLANIVVTLGIAADPSSVDPLIGVVQGGTGRLTREQYAARTGAIMALGYLANAIDDPRAMQYLQQGATVGGWNARNIGWSSPFDESAADRNLQLARVSILSLALTGKPAAAETLTQVAGRKGDQAGPAAETLATAATEALREHAIIASGGLASYYRRDVPAQPR